MFTRGRWVVKKGQNSVYVNIEWPRSVLYSPLQIKKIVLENLPIPKAFVTKKAKDNMLKEFFCHIKAGLMQFFKFIHVWWMICKKSFNLLQLTRRCNLILQLYVYYQGLWLRFWGFLTKCYEFIRYFLTLKFRDFKTSFQYFY